MARLHRTQSTPVTRMAKDDKKRRNHVSLLKKRARSTGHLEYSSKIVLRSLKCCSCSAENLEESIKIAMESLMPSKERWLALGLFCILSCNQCCIWNTWSPITNIALYAFPTWNKSSIALLSNWGCITYLTFCLPCCWLIYKTGLLRSLRVAAILSTIATFVRCLSDQEIVFTVMVHMAGILNGLSGVITGPLTALLSAVWFPRQERTTATGISFACNQLGMAVSYLIGPAILSDSSSYNLTLLGNIVNPVKNQIVSRMDSYYQLNYTHSSDMRENVNRANQLSTRLEIMSLMRIEFLMQFLLLMGILFFFPKDPCHPIDVSNISSDLTLSASILHLLRSKNMWQLSVANALSQGTTGPWFAMITTTFSTSITQMEADTLAFWTVVVSSILCLVTSRITDVFQGHIRATILTLIAISMTMFIWILLLDNQVLAFHKTELYFAVILGISVSWSTGALFLELGSEIAFPVSEAIVGGYMIFLSNLTSTLFFFSYFTPEFAELFSNYCVSGSLLIACVLTLCMKEEYKRMQAESDITFEIHRSAKKIMNNWKRQRNYLNK